MAHQKRQSLKVNVDEAVKAADQVAELERRRAGRAKPGEPAAMTTTAIHVPRDTLALLRRVAVERANREGGRPSVSGVLAALVERHRGELEAELR